MSYLISGLNIQNISDYDSTQSYNKYDVVDFQLSTAVASYPEKGVDGIRFWFNNEALSDFSLNQDYDVISWANKVATDSYLRQTSEDDEEKPYVDFNADYLELSNKENLFGNTFEVGENINSRTIFICFDAAPYSYTTFDNQTLMHFDTSNSFSSSYGKLEIGGNDSFSDASFNTDGKIYIDGVGYEAYSKIYNTQNIICITLSKSGATKNLKLRHNGKQIADLNTFNDNWFNSYLKIGGNNGNIGIKYYDIIGFDGILTEALIQSYEKYLFETYFNIEGLFFAKRDVPAGLETSPLAGGGGTFYWTRNINELFNLSYGSSVDFSCKLSTTDFDDGYKNSVARNINPITATFNFAYDGLTDIEAKSLIAFFENTPEAKKKSIYEDFEGVNMELFTPYKKDSEIYFLDIDHSTPYNNINSINIKGESLYDSSLDYKGLLVQLDEQYIRTYTSSLEGFEYNDVVYIDSSVFRDRGYYYYTGDSVQGSLPEENGPLGNDSHFTKNFYFKQDIDYSVPSQIRLRNLDLESSTKEYAKAGINYNVLQFDLNFSNRSDREARAILKFFDSKIGYNTFDYTLPQPYNKTIKVYCPEWSHTYNFKDNHSIKAKFIEFKSAADYYAGFNSIVTFVP